MKCEKCGYVNTNNMRYCPNCGNELMSDSTQSSIPNQNINPTPIPNNGFNPRPMPYNPNMSNGYMPNNSNNKKGLIIGIASILLIGVVVIILFLTGVIGGKNNNKEKPSELNNNNTNPEEKEKTTTPQYKYINIDLDKLEIEAEGTGKYTKNIEIEKAFLVYSSISKEETVDSVIVLAKNNNDVAVDISSELGFYDNEGYQIEHTPGHATAVRPHTEFILELNTLTTKGNNYDNYKITYKASRTPERYEDIGITNKDVEAVLGDKIGSYPNDILFSYKNNTGKKVSAIWILVKFYKGNDLIFVDKAYLSDIVAGTAKSGEAHGIRRKNIEHDRYEYIISAAYAYDNENW